MIVSEDIKRLEKLLRVSTESQIQAIQSQFEHISRFYGSALRSLIIQDFDLQEALKTAREFSRCDKINFAVIDGLMYQDEFFDLVFFFGEAYAYTGDIEFNENGSQIKYSEEVVEEG